MKNNSPRPFQLGVVAAAAAAFVATAPGAASAQSNGYGPDPDGDSNPATNTRLYSFIGDAAEAAFDPPWIVVTFEEASSHDKTIREQYKQKYGVSFSKGLKWQICEGPRYFRYDSQCTYLRAPSGRMAALYRDDYNRPLRVRFDEPVCAAALALYPTGGSEGEPFRVILQAYDENDNRIPGREVQEFTWTNDTFRWRLKVAAHFLSKKAKRVDVTVESRSWYKKDDDEIVFPDRMVRFLIDDVAYMTEDCQQALDDMAADRAAAQAE